MVGGFIDRDDPRDCRAVSLRRYEAGLKSMKK